MNPLASWQFWALGAAVFAALTAVLAKVGVEGVNSDFATFIRTIVILIAAGAMVVVTNHWQAPTSVPPKTWPIQKLGFDETFKRKWVYYLSYCEAGFAEGSIDVGIYQYKKPA